MLPGLIDSERLLFGTSHLISSHLISSLPSGTVTPTSTISAPPSFTPISQTREKPKVVIADKREETSQKMECLLEGRHGRSKNFFNHLHPQFVRCHKKKVIYPSQYTVVKISKKTRTVTARPKTVKSTLIRTSTSTSTIVPDKVSTTSSFKVTQTATAVETVVETSTVETTSTSTVFAPQETIYAACGSDNRE